METRDHENSTLAFLTEASTISPKDELRERIKIEFYKTYDVMTGIRIAATLGGFFSMMILLVLYKNYCKPSKSLSEEQLNAAVTAAAEEEDRALQAALEATSFYTSLGKQNSSLDNSNQVLLSPRFSSVGGGYSYMTPPLKVTVQQRGKSLPGSVLQFSTSGSPLSQPRSKENKRLTQDEDSDSHQQDAFACKNHLNPFSSRRVSSVTCSSADSSYLERRCSAFEVGLPAAPYYFRESREKLLSKHEEPWDYYYPIDIQVIQPTPEMSPSASENNLVENSTASGLQVPGMYDQMHRLSVTSFDLGLAPLASISSLGGFSQTSSATSKSFNTSSADNQQCTCADDSVGSDSVFLDDLEMEEIETDSEFEYDGFDDDYSFCESKQGLISRAEMRRSQFASFDSYDASITQESVAEIPEEEEEDVAEKQVTPKPLTETTSSQTSYKPHTRDFKRHTSLNDGNKFKKNLVKTFSEPKSGKFLKHLPPWTEKGRSKYVPKRQMSSPPRKKQTLEVSAEYEPIQLKEFSRSLDVPEIKSPKLDSSQEKLNAKDLNNLLLPSSANSSSNSSVPHIPPIQKSESMATSMPKQGLHVDMPLISQHKTKQLSLPTTREKRSRLQKQKNFNEDVKSISYPKEKTDGNEGEAAGFANTSEGLLKPRKITLTGSGERLASPTLFEEPETASEIESSPNQFEGGESCNLRGSILRPPKPETQQL